MQHHGLPTRLLDWSRTFAVALHFALIKPTDEVAVWILDPYALNFEVRGSRAVADVSFLGTYDDLYSTKNPPPVTPDVLAVTAAEHTSRLAGQRACFTLHNDLSRPLELLHPGCLRKITIGRAAYTGARQFLHLAGVSEFSLFPDLDGLARELRQTFCFD